MVLDDFGFGAGKDDFKRKTLNFFRATRDFNNGSLWPARAPAGRATRV